MSPPTAIHDKVLKFNAYQNAGVCEYWIIDPADRIAQVFIGMYIAKSHGETDTVPVNMLEGCEISLSDVFAE